MLDIKDLTLKYGQSQILNGINKITVSAWIPADTRSTEAPGVVDHVGDISDRVGIAVGVRRPRETLQRNIYI